MAPVAAIVFEQNSVVGSAGISFVGNVADGVVNVSNFDNTDVARWIITLLNAPIESALVPGVLLDSTSIDNVDFTPDADGNYQIQLEVRDGTGTIISRDTKDFIAATARGWILPAFRDTAATLNQLGNTVGWMLALNFIFADLRDNAFFTDTSYGASTGDVLTWSGTAWAPAPPSSVTWAEDLAGSSNTQQWVAEISGSGGTGGTVPLNDIDFEWSATSVTPKISQATRANNSLSENLTISAQAPFAGASGANRFPGNLVFQIPQAVGGAVLDGGVQVHINTTPIITMGEWQNGGGTYGAIWLGGNASAAASSTFALLGSSTASYLNGVSDIYFGINNTYYSHLTSTKLEIGLYVAPQYQFDLSATAILHFTTNASTVKVIYDPQTTDTLPTDIVFAGQGAYTSATGANRTPGGFTFLFTNPTNSGTSYAQLSLKRGSDTHARIDSEFGVATFGGATGPGYHAAHLGPLTGDETNYAGIWLLSASTARTSSNAVIESDGISLIVNSPNAGASIRFLHGAATQSIQLSPGARLQMDVPNIDWDEGQNPPALTQFARTSDVATHPFRIVPQEPFAGSTGTNRLPGHLQVDIVRSITGASHSGGLEVQINSTATINMGEYVDSGTTYGAIWFSGSNAATPTSSNWAFLGSAADTYFNAPSSTMYFGVSGTYYMTMSVGGLSLGVGYTTPNFSFDFSDTAVIHFKERNTTSKIIADPKTSDAATIPFIIAEQAAFASATGANRTPGGIQFLLTDPTNGGTTYSSVYLKRNSTTYASIESLYGLVTAGETTTNFYAVIGPLLTAGNANAGLWLLPGGVAPSTGNVAIYADSTNVWINGRTSSYLITMSVAGAAAFFTWDSNNDTMTSGLNFWKWSQGMATPTITQVVKTSGSGVDMLIEAQTAQQSGDTNGGFLNLSGGASHGTGLDGGVRLKINTDTTIVEVTEVVNGSHVLALLLGTTLTSTNMPSGSGNRVVFFADCLSAPAVSGSDPVGGGILYSDTGALTWHGTSGTKTTLGAAEPHCPRCGSDFALEWKNPKYGGRLALCMKCLAGSLDRHGISFDEFAIEVPEAA